MIKFKQYMLLALLPAFPLFAHKLGNELKQQVEISHTGIAARQAIQSVRDMQTEILEAQKIAIKKFKSLPESDDIRIYFDKNFYGWSVSERSFNLRKENFEPTIASYEKDFNGDALIDELRIYSKRVQRNAQDLITRHEKSIQQRQKELTEGKWMIDGKPIDLNQDGVRTIKGLLILYPAEIEFQKKVLELANSCEMKIKSLSHQ